VVQALNTHCCQAPPSVVVAHDDSLGYLICSRPPLGVHLLISEWVVCSSGEVAIISYIVVVPSVHAQLLASSRVAPCAPIRSCPPSRTLWLVLSSAAILDRLACSRLPCMCLAARACRRILCARPTSHRLPSRPLCVSDVSTVASKNLITGVEPEQAPTGREPERSDCALKTY
jgi:hypothetical protein